MTPTYYKEGRRYLPTGKDISFYADGIWIVKNDQKSAMRILKIGELPELYPFASMAVSVDALAGVIADARRKEDNSATDIARAVMKWMASTHPMPAEPKF